MKNRKTSVNLTEGNYRKIKKLVDQTGRSQSDLINSAVANVPIVVLGNQQTVAEIFFRYTKHYHRVMFPVFEGRLAEHVCA